MLIGSPPFLLSRRREINESDQFTIAERRFFYALLRTNGNQKAAFVLAFPHKNLKNPDSAATKMMKRIRSKYNFNALLNESGLGYERLIFKMAELLEAKNTKFYQDESLGEFPDNATQMQAAKTLAEMHGLLKQVVEHQGTITLTEAIQEAYEYHKALRLVGSDEHRDSTTG